MLEGGRPDLDDKYTVFGEVVSGMKTVFKIQMVETNTEDRPLKNIKIKYMQGLNHHKLENNDDPEKKSNKPTVLLFLIIFS